jgi:hypothetical protein
MAESSFVITSRDADDNVMYSSGLEIDDFEISFTGHTDWAKQGRTDESWTNIPITIDRVANNAYIASSRCSVSTNTPCSGDGDCPTAEKCNLDANLMGKFAVVSEDWGHADQEDGTPLCVSCATVLYGDSTVSVSDLRSVLNRGERIRIGNEIVVVHETLPFDGTMLTLTAPFHGTDVVSGPVYRVGARTGKYLVRYTPLVRGTYQLNIKLTRIDEVQSITIQSMDAISGTFQLSHGGKTTTGIPTSDSDGSAVTSALAAIGLAVDVQVGSVSATLKQWLVTFPNNEGDVAGIVPDGAMLTGTAINVKVAEVARGRGNTHIDGSPFYPKVHPAPTHPRRTIAYGPGLTFGEAGQESRFTIQSKDDYGNDREEDQGRDVYRVVAFQPSNSAAEYEATVTYIRDGTYACEFIPEWSGQYTVAVIMRTRAEIQLVTTSFINGQQRGGTFSLFHYGKSTVPLAWDASASSVETALEALGTAGDLHVTRKEKLGDSGNNPGFEYSVTFVNALGIIDIMTASDDQLVGRASPAGVTVTRNADLVGRSQHIKT